MRIVLLTSAIVMFAATQASAALVLQNGSFELPVGTTEITQGNTAGNWTASGPGPSAFIATAATFGGTLAALDGGQYIQVNANGGGRISQLVGATDAGPASDITLSAGFSARTGFETGLTYSFGLYSDADGLVPLAESTGLTPPVGSWDVQSVTATGVAGGTDVYVFFSAPDLAPLTRLLWVDDVTLSVTQIPEPSSMLLVGLGVLGMGVVRRRRQR